MDGRCGPTGRLENIENGRMGRRGLEEWIWYISVLIYNFKKMSLSLIPTHIARVSVGWLVGWQLAAWVGGWSVVMFVDRCVAFFLGRSVVWLVVWWIRLTSCIEIVCSFLFIVVYFLGLTNLTVGCLVGFWLPSFRNLKQNETKTADVDSTN